MVVICWVVIRGSTETMRVIIGPHGKHQIMNDTFRDIKSSTMSRNKYPRFLAVVYYTYLTDYRLIIKSTNEG